MTKQLSGNVQDFLGVNNTKDVAIKASAVSYVTEATPSVMILHGEKDSTVPLAQSEAFYEKLQQKGVYSSFYILEDAEHGDDGFFQNNVLENVNQFLKKVL